MRSFAPLGGIRKDTLLYAEITDDVRRNNLRLTVPGGSARLTGRFAGAGAGAEHLPVPARAP